jgi:hypothetical protein
VSHCCEYSSDRNRERKYAKRHHYFWLACDICGFERGGHESSREPGIPHIDSPGLGTSVCGHCRDIADEYVMLNGNLHHVGKAFRRDWDAHYNRQLRLR